jgi:hypothetical protein
MFSHVEINYEIHDKVKPLWMILRSDAIFLKELNMKSMCIKP